MMYCRWPLHTPFDLFSLMSGMWAELKWDIWKRVAFLPAFLVSTSGFTQTPPQMHCVAMKNRYFLSWITLQTLGLCCASGQLAGRIGKAEGKLSVKGDGPAACGLGRWLLCPHMDLDVEPSVCPVEWPRKEGGFLSFCCQGLCSAADKSKVQSGMTMGLPPLPERSDLLGNAFLRPGQLTWAELFPAITIYCWGRAGEGPGSCGFF